MSHFYGWVHGQSRTEATRRGSKNSGLTANINSWNCGIAIRARHNSKENTDLFFISLTSGSSPGPEPGNLVAIEYKCDDDTIRILPSEMITKLVKNEIQKEHETNIKASSPNQIINAVDKEYKNDSG